MKAYEAKMSCNQVVADLAMYLIKINSSFINNVAVSLYKSNYKSCEMSCSQLHWALKAKT